MNCPDHSFTLVGRREQLGGTWDLFRYPGIRSDSDMHTLGFIFAPWKHEKSIADGPAILDYLNRIVDERHIHERLRLVRQVVGADWDSAAVRWTIGRGSCRDRGAQDVSNTGDAVSYQTKQHEADRT